MSIRQYPKVDETVITVTTAYPGAASDVIQGFITSAIAFALERSTPDTREDSWLLSQVWLQRFAYRQLFSIVLFKTVIRAIKGEPFAWDKLERTAAVTFEEREESVEVH